MGNVTRAISRGVRDVLDFLTGSPRRTNDTHDAILQQEQWARQLQAERERFQRELREQQERLYEKLEQQAALERERLERQHREERERYERAMQVQLEQQAAAAAAQLQLHETVAAAERERLQRAAEEERLRHELELRRLEEESRARLAKQREDAERQLQEQQALALKQQEESDRKQAELQSKWLAGVQPEVWPTPEERKHAEGQLIEPREEHFHCAIAGLAGCGKSSLINAFRGLRNTGNSPDTAPIGITETTLTITAYRDPSPTLPRSRFVWYDVPGAGTLTIPGWQYFNSQGLFVFDLIIVVVDNRFSEQDLAILKHCERYKIPSFLVRSKANQHIYNIMTQAYEWEGTDDERDFNEVYQPARETLVRQTKASIRKNLRAGEMDPGKEVFIVSCDALASYVREEKKQLKKTNQLIDEERLVQVCLQAVRARRYPEDSTSN